MTTWTVSHLSKAQSRRTMTTWTVSHLSKAQSAKRQRRHDFLQWWMDGFLRFSTHSLRSSENKDEQRQEQRQASIKRTEQWEASVDGRRRATSTVFDENIAKSQKSHFDSPIRPRGA
jgi:hypothetical protein